ncbi:MAG: class I SAM-dependent methyltransferase [Oscillospiraceae bacterium]|nr:class I SAM-dependent methyltransferase [Oscillospiraceae bacterium]
MTESKNLVVCMGKGAQRDAAAALARRVGASLSDKPGPQLTLMVDGSGISLMGYGLSYRGDFEQMLHRVTKGRLQHEMLVHVSKTDDPHPTAVDATAGMGEDAFLLAASGYSVTLFEQNPVIAALLKDALRRAKKHPDLKEIAQRMQLVEGNSIELLPTLGIVPDLIYLDPMFPARQKSGLINKKLQLIQKLEHPCVEEEALLNMAIGIHPPKIIIKRPLKGANLAGRTPSYSVRGKAIRYDCITLPRNSS